MQDQVTGNITLNRADTFTLSFKLKPGRYKLVVAATDTAGNKSRAFTKSFRVKRR